MQIDGHDYVTRHYQRRLAGQGDDRLLSSPSTGQRKPEIAFAIEERYEKS